MPKRVVIIGGVAGGASAAARLRRLDDFAEITVLERGPYVSFANCGLPYYVGRVIKEKETLLLMTPEKFRDRFNIDVRINNEAVAIDRQKKQVKVRNLMNDNEYVIDYDVLVLSPGASPIVPPIKGMDKVPVFVLRNIPHCMGMEEYVSVNKPKSAVIIGGGFIGLEVAENLIERGVMVTIVELLDQVMMPLDKEMAQWVHQELLMNGVDLVLGDGVKEFDKKKDGKLIVKTQSDKIIETDMIVLSIGIKPENKLAKDSGLPLGPKGHIVVDDHMRTSDPNIYAIGDVVQIKDFITKEDTAVPLAGPANQQGRIVANNIAGIDSIYNGSVGAAVLKLFDMTIANVGLNEKQLRNSKIRYEKVYIHPNNHSGYYPGAQVISTKLIFEIPSGRILGAQIVGGPGAEKRIDVISTAIQFGAKVQDLQQLQLTYAPPYASAKDPVNMAGYVATNVINGLVKIWHWDQFNEIEKSKGFILDVRTKDEFNIGHIKGAVNISDLELRKRMNELPKDKNTPIYVYCQVGFRGYVVYRNLVQNGYKNVCNLSGGYKTFEIATKTIESMRNEVGDLHEIVKEKTTQKEKPTTLTDQSDIIKVDATGLSCPGPLNELIKTVKTAPIEKIIEIVSSDPSFTASVNAWTQLTDGVELISVRKFDGNIVARVRKTKEDIKIVVDETPTHEEIKKEEEHKKERLGRIKPAGEPPVTNISIEELYERCCTERGPAIKVDVRPLDEIRTNGGIIPESIVIPLGDLIQDTSKLDAYKDKEIVLYCAVGGRSSMAAQILARKGFKDVRSLYGGIHAWISHGYKLEKI